MTLLVLIVVYAAAGVAFAVPLLEFALGGLMTLALLWFLAGSLLSQLGVDVMSSGYALALYGVTFAFQLGAAYLLFGLRRTRIVLDDVIPLAVFAAIFLIAHRFCLTWPDFIAMGERLRDYALLAQSSSFPLAAQEPWMEGTGLNYYVFWYRLAHILRAVLGFEVWDTYHALAAYALAAYAAVLYQLTRVLVSAPRLLSLFAAIIVPFGSNIAGFLNWIHNDHNWWGPSRVVKGAINEFPAWSFLLGDLHPHFLNLNVLPLAILLTYRFWVSEVSLTLRALNIGAMTVTTAFFLLASNAWEVPMWAGFVAALSGMLVFAHRELILRHLRGVVHGVSLFDTVKAVGCVLLMVVTALGFSVKSATTPLFVKVFISSVALGFAAVFFPFRTALARTVVGLLRDRRAVLVALTWVGVAVACKLSGAHIQAEGGALTFVRAPIELTTISELARHWGLPLAVIGVCTVALTLPWGLGVLTGVALAMSCLNDRAILFLGLLAFSQALRIFTSKEPGEARRAAWCFEEAIVLSALGLLLLPEFVFLDDPYGGENERMNTIFKVYTTAWALVALSALVLALRLYRYVLAQVSVNVKEPQKTISRLRIGAVCASAVALFITLPFFKLTASIRKSPQFLTEPSQEGLSEVERKFPGSAAIIRILRDRPRGRVLEAQGNPYDYTSFVSTLAGQPAYLGWANHVELLSKQYAEVSRRRDMTGRIYSEADCIKRRDFARSERITYVVVGSLEKQKHPQIRSFDFSCFSQVAQERDYTLYMTELEEAR